MGEGNAREGRKEGYNKRVGRQGIMRGRKGQRDRRERRGRKREGKDTKRKGNAGRKGMKKEWVGRGI